MLWSIDVIFPDQSTASLVVHDSGVPKSIEPATTQLRVLTFLEGFSHLATDSRKEVPDVPLAKLDDVDVDVVGMALVVYGGHMVFKTAAIVTAVRKATEVASTDSSDQVIDVAEWYQSAADGPHPADDEPVELTVRQAQKVAAIATAVLRGHEGFNDALTLAARFLQSSAFVSLGLRSSESPADIWARIDEYPWPRSGEPNPQPDI